MNITVTENCALHFLGQLVKLFPWHLHIIFQNILTLQSRITVYDPPVFF